VPFGPAASTLYGPIWFPPLTLAIRPLHMTASFHEVSISATSCSTASTGSAAIRIGRPTTR
jgi:hypothetical protein